VATTALQPARKGEVTPREYTLKSGGSAINLSGVTAVRLHYRRAGDTAWNMASTVDSSPMLAITTAASGIVTFTPTATFWQVGVYTIYFSVDTGTDYSLPNTDYYSVTVVEGA
jgi:hypothetical protein